MKFTKNIFAPLTITLSFYSLSIVIPLFLALAVFRPQEAKASFLTILISAFAVVAANIIAEAITYYRASRSTVTITLGENMLTLNQNGKSKKKAQIKYSDIRYLDFDIGFATKRYKREKFALPQLNIHYGEYDAVFSITNPSLLMIYHIKKKASSAKFSNVIFAYLLLPTILLILFLILFAIAK